MLFMSLASFSVKFLTPCKVSGFKLKKSHIMVGLLQLVIGSRFCFGELGDVMRNHECTES